MIKFVGDKNTIEPICESITDNFLLCSAEFKNEGKYFITIEGYFTEYFFNVFHNYENNQIEDDSDEIEDDSSDESEDYNSNQIEDDNSGEIEDHNSDENEYEEEDDNKGNIYNLKKILFLLSLFIFI